jgi:hypothetical protein
MWFSIGMSIDEMLQQLLQDMREEEIQKMMQDNLLRPAHARRPRMMDMHAAPSGGITMGEHVDYRLPF